MSAQIPSPPTSKSTPGVLTCSWCGTSCAAGGLSCPGCGANLETPSTPRSTGWTKVPGRKDMARLQFGNSSCQIEGDYVPVAEFRLAAEDSLYFAHHVLLWKDADLHLSLHRLKGFLRRFFGGMNLILSNAQGPGHVAFSRDAPGELIALPLRTGGSVDVREKLFLVATGQVTYDWFRTKIWYTTRSEREKKNKTHYPVGRFMDRFSAPSTPGLLMLHAAGNVFVRELAVGQNILIRPTALLFKDPSVQMQLHFEQPRRSFQAPGSQWNRCIWLRLTGPGRIAAQSVFEPLEGEHEFILRNSRSTQFRW